MAQVEQRIIIVDADLRRPHLHEIFGLSNTSGLTTMMIEDAVLEDPPLQETTVPGLQLLASGTLPPRPADLLGSQRMTRVIEALAKHADTVIYDAPPVMMVTDAVVLATKMDGVLLVVSAGETKRDHTQQSIERLRKVNAHVIGAVLNNVPLDSIMHEYYG
jgi:capsular exopolysaccharide synthesis family protein